MPDQPHRPVVIIVPVYLGLQATKNCLESLQASDLPDWASVLLINDASPDPQIARYCDQAAAGAGFELWTNRENLGFVKTVNRGFAYQHDADVILLNSDTVVAGNWIERLRASAGSAPDIGTVTPLSNNGTICSYPVFLQPSPLPASWSQPELDELAARVNAGRVVNIPTGVGFCLYIKRECLIEVGEFNAERFGHGYGEECDFSLRAAEKGWRNVAAADVFVFHEGGVSFAEQAEPRKLHAEAVLAELHPSYQADVLAFIEADPLAGIRRALDLARLQAKPQAGGEVLVEQERHHARMGAELSRRLEIAQQDIQEELRQKAALETHLHECRQAFAATDTALKDAQQMIVNLRDEIVEVTQRLQAASNTVHARNEELGYLQAHLSALEAKLADMENSRSWRYTAWLRRSGS